jgi:Costars
MASLDVNHEVKELVVAMKRLGEEKDGKVHVKFGVLFKDDIVANTFEALVGTLRAAKKRGIIKFPGQMLLSPTHDDVTITLEKDE